jgi:hypothetical protein
MNGWIKAIDAISDWVSAAWYSGRMQRPCSRGFRGLSHARQNHGRHHRCPRAKSHRTIWALRRRTATGQGRAQLVSGPVWRGGPCVGRTCGPHHRMGGVPAVCPPVPARAQRASMQAKRSQALVQVALRRRRIVCLVIVWPIERVVSFARVGWSRNFNLSSIIWCGVAENDSNCYTGVGIRFPSPYLVTVWTSVYAL